MCACVCEHAFVCVIVWAGHKARPASAEMTQCRTLTKVTLIGYVCVCLNCVG